ncbi:MAG: hypothetical protein ACOC5B_02245 [Myxococcota bacterium]
MNEPHGVGGQVRGPIVGGYQRIEAGTQRSRAERTGGGHGPSSVRGGQGVLKRPGRAIVGRVERDLTGRCGTCAFFIVLRTNEQGVSLGECRLGCWPSPLGDTATCSSHKPIGTPWKKKGTARARRGRRARPAPSVPGRPPLPKEIDLDMDTDEFRSVLRQVLQEELGMSDATMGERWQGGELVLIPGKEGTQEKRVPIDAFFHKIVMVRDKLRVLEQKINGHSGLSDEDKVALQQYVTACYGSLTTFNALFRDREDGFVGQRTKE